MNSDSSENSLLKWFFDGPFERRFFSWYRRFFSISEIETSRTLQYVIGIGLFTMFLTFFRGWETHPAVTLASYLNDSYLCWPYFQSCGNWYFLNTLPLSYSQSSVYALFLGLLALASYFLYRKEWVLAHLSLSILWLWKFLLIFVFSMSLALNFDYYDVILLFIFLFLPNKLFFLRLTFAGLYFLAATLKFHSGWILGTYFTSLTTGLPLFPDALAPLFTNLIIGMQIIGAWFLFSSREIFQRIALSYFIFFHLFSAVIINYRFPAAALAYLIILFGINREFPSVPLTRKSLAGWIFIALLVMTQLSPLLIRGDERLTGEGNFYRISVFEANHQCRSRFTIYNADGQKRTQLFEYPSANNRCTTYRQWFFAKQWCLRDPSIQRIAWQFDHSIDGGPFYRTVDTQNACELSYKAFSHNQWIRLPEGDAPIVGYPVQNLYYND